MENDKQENKNDKKVMKEGNGNIRLRRRRKMLYESVVERKYKEKEEKKL